MTENEMVGWHHQLNGHEFEQTLGDGENRKVWHDKESALRIRWLKYWSFSFNISPLNEYSGLISFRIG